MIQNIKEKLYRFTSSNKLFVVSIILFILLIVFSIYNNKRSNERFVDYITKLGYYNEDGGNLYYYNVGGISLEDFNDDVSNGLDSHYEINYFDVNEVLFKKNFRDYTDKMNTLLNFTYDYKSGVVTYSYRGVSNNEAVLMFSGEYSYKDDAFDFSCNKDYRYQYDVDSNDDLVCTFLKGKVENFYVEAINVIEKYSVVDNVIK